MKMEIQAIDPAKITLLENGKKSTAFKAISMFLIHQIVILLRIAGRHLRSIYGNILIGTTKKQII